MRKTKVNVNLRGSKGEESHTVTVPQFETIEELRKELPDKLILRVINKVVWCDANFAIRILHSRQQPLPEEFTLEEIRLQMHASHSV